MKIRGNTVTTTRKETPSLPLSGGKMEGAVDMNLQELTNLRTPVGDRDAVNKKFLEDAIKENSENLKEENEDYTNNAAEAMKTKPVQAKLTVSGWSASAPYTQTITVEGLSDEKFARAYPEIPDNAEEEETLEEETAKVTSCKRTGNQMTFRCREEKPEQDIPVIVEVYA